MRKTLLAAALPLATLSMLLGAAAQDATPAVQIIEGTTAPSEKRQITFNNPGVISEVLVQPGDIVKRSQLLMKLNDEVEQARLVSLKADADVELKVQAAEKQRNLAKVEWDNKKALFAKNAASEFEVQTAQAEYEVRAINVDVTRQEGAVKQSQVLVQERRLQDMLLNSPIDGVIVEIRSKEGEIAAESRPVIDIVKLDPLNIDVKLASPKQVQQLKVGQTVKVRYPEGQWMDAKVKFISPIVDASSGRQAFRLEVPNPELRAAGLPMQVQLPALTAAAQ